MRAIFVALFCALAISSKSLAACHGRIINPVTEVCWECVFPISIASNTTLVGGNFPDVSTNAEPFCSCVDGINTTVGMNIGFWEPLRTIEIVREPFCFPTLGGLSLGGTGWAPAHGRTPNPKERGHRTSFYQVHWYHTPWLYLMELLIDTRCLEQSAWDVAYMTELDPLWDDAMTAFLLNPDAALFANPIAVGACAADCVAASASLPLNALYWCAGCAGSIFPLTGWVASHITDEQAWSLLTQRFTLKMHREGLLWRHWGRAGQCAPRLEWTMSKNVYRSQMIYPSRLSQSCPPYGRTTALMALGGTTPPLTGEDGAYLIWRRRDCCQGLSLETLQ